jgi:hypothetical protein
MIFKANKNSNYAIFCDFSSSWHPYSEFFDQYGYAWPEDFDDTEKIGEARFQVIEDLSSGLSLYNYGGNLYPYSEKKILQRSLKIKDSVILERFGDRNSFSESNVFFLDIGYNLGSVEYMVFAHNNDHSPFSRIREVVCKFPLSALSQILLPLREKHRQGLGQLSDLEKIAKDEISRNIAFTDWQLMERYISPSEDEYREICELPLHHYHFQYGEEIDVWVKFEYYRGINDM